MKKSTLYNGRKSLTSRGVLALTILVQSKKGQINMYCKLSLSSPDKVEDPFEGLKLIVVFWSYFSHEMHIAS